MSLQNTSTENTSTDGPQEHTVPLPAGRERVFLVVLDDSPEMPVALHYASLRARATGGRVALLACLENADFGHWMSVDEIIREEALAATQSLFHRWGGEAMLWSGERPVYYLKEGDLADALFDLLKTGEISLLVLAARSGKDGPGPMVSDLMQSGMSNFGVPVTSVPDTLTDDDLADLT
ncbi:MAG: universal stress protein [Alphaproteobacteria bacterium]